MKNPRTNARKFKDALALVARACSKDPDRPALQLVRLTTTAGKIRIEAADGFRAHRHDLDGTAEKGTNVLLSPEQIVGIKKYKIARKDDPDLIVDLGAGRLLIDGKATPGKFTTEYQYPDLDQVWPVGSPALAVTVSPAELFAAVKRARVYSREGSNVIEFHISDQILIYAHSEALGESWNVIDPLWGLAPLIERTRIHDLAIGFNADFVLDILKGQSADVKIKVNQANTPAIFSYGDFSVVLMPMHVGNPGTRTAADIPNPDNFRPAPYTTEEYYAKSDAWAASNTVRNDEDSRIQIKPSDPDRDVFVPATPEPGAVIREISTVWSYLSEGDRKKDDIKLVLLHLDDGTPDPSAPIALDTVGPNRHPLFSGTTLTIGECEYCTDTEPHALIDGQCNPCRANARELADLARRSV